MLYPVLGEGHFKIHIHEDDRDEITVTNVYYIKRKRGQISSYPKKQGWGSVLCALLVDRKVTATVCFPPSQWYLELLWIISFLHGSTNSLQMPSH